MKIYIVGIGMDGAKTLTAEAKNAIETADVLIGAKRMTEPFAHYNKSTFESWKADEIKSFFDKCDKNSAAVLMSGDCGFFSGADKLTKLLNTHDVTIISGISTPVYLCTKHGLTWQDMCFISLHGADANIALNVHRNHKCFFLLGGNITPSDICKRLCEYGMSDVIVHIGSRLSYPDESIISGTAGELTEVICDELCSMITENPDYDNRIRFGIPDCEFIRCKVPMTKSEIRSVVASKLNLCYNDILWDIGCGTGSVSVESALAAYEGTVFAVDKNDEACSLTEQNAHKFFCDNIRIINGSAPEILSDLPLPDKVFIGGTNGHISTIIHAAFRNGNMPEIVITAVSLETLNEAVSALKSHNLKTNVTQLAAIRYKEIGSHTMPDSQNPVFIIEGKAR